MRSESQIIEDIEVGGVRIEGAGKSVLGVGIALPIHENQANGKGNLWVSRSLLFDLGEQIGRRRLLPAQVKRLSSQQLNGERALFEAGEAIEIAERRLATLGGHAHLRQMQVCVGVPGFNGDDAEIRSARSESPCAR